MVQPSWTRMSIRRLEEVRNRMRRELVQCTRRIRGREVAQSAGYVCRCPRERDADGGGRGPRHRAQVPRLDVVRVGLSRATRRHRSFPRIGLENVHHRAGALLLGAVRRKAHAALGDLAPKRQATVARIVANGCRA